MTIVCLKMIILTGMFWDACWKPKCDVMGDDVATKTPLLAAWKKQEWKWNLSKCACAHTTRSPQMRCAHSVLWAYVHHVEMQWACTELGQKIPSQDFPRGIWHTGLLQTCKKCIQDWQGTILRTCSPAHNFNFYQSKLEWHNNSHDY